MNGPAQHRGGREPRSRWTRRPGLVALGLIALGLLVRSPSLGLGFYADDLMHQAVLGQGGVGPMQPPYGLYDFGTLADYEDLESPATFPWWTSSDWKIRFCRPLSSALLTLEHAAFGDAALGYHVVGLALFALVSLLAWTTLTGLGLTSGTALLALAFFVLSRAAVLPVGWIANHNEVWALAGVLAALSAITRHGRCGRGLATLGALAGSAFALGAKESGIVAPGVTAAWLWLEARRRPDVGFGRWAAWTGASLLALCLAYLAALVGLGYGERSAFYTTPWVEPLATLERLVVLATAGWAPLCGLAPLDALTVEPQLALPAAGVATVALAFLGHRIARVVRGRTAIGFAVVWWALALLPQAGAPPSDRLLFPAVLPAAVLLATFVTAVDADPSATGRRRLGAWTIVGLAGALSALTSIPLQLVMNSLARDIRATVPTAAVGPPALGRREVFVLQVTDPMAALSFAPSWAASRDDLDLRFWLLQGGRRGVRIERTSARTVEIESLDVPFATQPFEVVYRSSRAPAAVGDRLRTAAFDVEVLAVAGGGIQRARFVFARPLDDPKHRWVTWDGGGYGPVEIPAVGATLELPAFDPPNPFSP